MFFYPFRRTSASLSPRQKSKCFVPNVCFARETHPPAPDSITCSHQRVENIAWAVWGCGGWFVPRERSYDYSGSIVVSIQPKSRHGPGPWRLYSWISCPSLADAFVYVMVMTIPRSAHDMRSNRVMQQSDWWATIYLRIIHKYKEICK